MPAGYTYLPEGTRYDPMSRSTLCTGAFASWQLDVALSALLDSWLAMHVDEQYKSTQDQDLSKEEGSANQLDLCLESGETTEEENDSFLARISTAPSNAQNVGELSKTSIIPRWEAANSHLPSLETPPRKMPSHTETGRVRLKRLWTMATIQKKWRRQWPFKPCTPPYGT